MPKPKFTPPPCGAPPVELVVTFERIGRDHDVPPLTVTWTDVHELAAAIHAHAAPAVPSVPGRRVPRRTTLAGPVTIDGGSYGKGTVRRTYASTIADGFAR